MRLLLEKSYNSIEDYDLLTSDKFNTLSDHDKISITKNVLNSVPNKNKLKRSFDYYVKVLSEKVGVYERAEYFDYLLKLKIDLGPHMAANINYYISKGKLDINNLPEYLNDEKFYRNETDQSAADKLKVIMYFSDEDHLKKWQTDGYDIIAHLKNEDGTWKTYAKMVDVMNEVEKLAKTKGVQSVGEVINKLATELASLNKNLNRQEISEFLWVLHRNGNSDDKLMTKALKAAKEK